MGFWKGFLLDFDGTIVVTESLAARAMEIVLEENGISEAGHLASVLHGRTWSAGIRILMTHFPHLDAAVLGQRMREIYRYERKKGGVEFVPGALHALKLLRGLGVPVALVTGSDRDEVYDILGDEVVGKYFDLIVTASDGLESKPSPAQYNAALQTLGLNPEATLVFEDSYAGIESSKRAGLAFIHVLHVSPLPGPHVDAIAAIQDWRGMSRERLAAFYGERGKHFPSNTG